MSSPLLRPARKTAVRFLVIGLLLSGASPINDVLDGSAPGAYPASSATNDPDTSAEVSMDQLDVPETAAADAVAPDVDAPDAGGPNSAAPDAGAPEVVAEMSDPTTRDFGMIGVTWVAGTAPADLVVELRTRTEGEWTPWEGADAIELDDEGATRSGTEPVWVGESDGVQVRMLSTQASPEDAKVVLIDGGTGLPESGALMLVSSESTDESTSESTGDLTSELTDESTTESTRELTSELTDESTTESTGDETFVPAATTDGVAPMPVIVTRAEWGVDVRGQSSCTAPVTSSVLKGIVLHHTAGANGYTREQAPGIVRGIHAYHTRSLGWCDIGYNFLVDSFGTVYEGRRGGITKQVRGAHAGNWDVNTYATGISMIGNYDTVDVPTATRRSVIKLMAWRLSSFGLGAFGKYKVGSIELPRISGHRDIYSNGVRPATATACPGRYGYAWLNSGTRKRVQNHIDAAAEAAPEPSPTPAPSPSPEPELADPAREEASVPETAWVPADRQLVLRGRGYGHGRGMSQNGAQGAAEQGLTYDEITDFYYPGTESGTVKGRIRVLITADVTNAVVVDATEGLRIRNLVDRSVRELPVRSRIKRWRLVPRKGGRTVVQFDNGRWRRWKATWAANLTGDAEFLANGPMTLTTPAGRRAYRGILRSASPEPGVAARDTVNVVTMDQYVRGVLATEMPASWHLEALKAQAVAARTYATWSRERYRTRYYQVCDTTDCQVYGGASAEHPRSNRAVRQTRREIRTYQGGPAFTQFSSSSGGWTTAGGAPYLRAQEDPYDAWSGNSLHRWSTRIEAAEIESAYPAIGRLRSIEVAGRDGNGQWEGRVTRLLLDGSQKRVEVSADAFRMALGLRSTWFKVKPTPIIRRWYRLGGPGSDLGSPRRTEVAVAAGTKQRFDHGTMFHSRATGPRELSGTVLRTYAKAGGPGGVLGFPTTAVRERGRHRLARFQGGGIYKLRAKAPVTVTGKIHARYVRAGWIRDLGWPLTSHYRVNNGERVDFGKASIVWNRNTGRTRVLWK